MKRRRETISWGLALGLLLAAAALHLIFAFALEGVLRVDWKGAPLPQGDGVMEVSLVPATPDEAPADDEAELRDPKDAPQLVQNQALVNEERPDDTNRISEFDQKVDDERLAPNQRPIVGTRPRPRGDQAQTSQNDAETAPEERRADGDTKGDAELGEGNSSADSNVSESEQGRLADERGAAKNTAPKGLRGTPDQLQGLFGRPGTYDHVPDVERGDANILNSRRNKYASFFNRVRDQVSQEWEPDVLHAKHDPYGKIYGTKTRTTRLRILLNPDGSVHRIYVDQASGVAYLDEEAIRAVRLGAPFINPPPQLIDPRSGKIDFTFNFILMIDGQKRIFRYKR